MPVPYIIPSMTPEEQVAYAEETLALIEQRLSEVKDPEVKLHLADSKVYYIKLAEDGKNRLRVSARDYY